MINKLKQAITVIPNYPKSGIDFYDLTTLFSEGELFKTTTQLLVDSIASWSVTKIVAIEARGFILGASVAHQLGLGLVLARKSGKLPRETYEESYDLEYGSASLAIHRDALSSEDSVIIIDDLLATGGTAQATCRLCERTGARISGIAALAAIEQLPFRDKLSDYPLTWLIGL